MDAETLAAIENKLSSARTRLILDKPFLGALVLRLPLQAADPSWCATTGTDAKKFYYNPEYIQELRADETQFVLAHEALHCALSHFARRGHRIKHRWDIACDYAINPILMDEGLTAPPGSLMMNEYRGMTAEEIYPLIEDNDHSETLDQHLYDKQDQTSEGGQDQQQNPLDQQTKGTSKSDQGDQQESQPQSGGEQRSDDEDEQDGDQDDQRQTEGPSAGDQQQPSSGLPQNDDNPQQQPAMSEPNDAPPQPQPQPAVSDDDPPQNAEPEPLTEAEKDALHVQWQQRLAGAAQQAQQAGKLGSEMARMIDFFLQPTLPWRVLLARYMNTIARDDYSYTRPSSRRGDPAIYPSLRSAQMEVVVAVDVSGSIHRDELNEFIAEIDSLKAQVRARVTLVTCDNTITCDQPWVFEPWDHCQLPEQISGGGGTDFNPVFAWVERRDLRPDLLIYFTDARGEFPKIEAAYPTIWLVKGNQPVPWGQRIQLN